MVAIRFRCYTYLGAATEGIEHVEENKASEGHRGVSWRDLVVIGHLHNRTGEHGALLLVNYSGVVRTKVIHCSCVCCMYQQQALVEDCERSASIEKA